MTDVWLNDAIELLGLSHNAAASALGINRTTLWRYRRGHRDPPTAVTRLLEAWILLVGMLKDPVAFTNGDPLVPAASDVLPEEIVALLNQPQEG